MKNFYFVMILFLITGCGTDTFSQETQVLKPVADPPGQQGGLIRSSGCPDDSPKSGLHPMECKAQINGAIPRLKGFDEEYVRCALLALIRQNYGVLLKKSDLTCSR